MKNSQNGFVAPLLIGIIAILVIGGGIYLYENKKVEVPVVVDTTTQQSNEVQQQTITQTPVVTQPKVPPATTKPTIVVLSPNGGETFQQNSPITVKWSQNFSASASICLMGDAGCVYNSTPVMFNSGVNTWTIPANTNVTTCTTNNCYVADGFKVSVTTDNQPGSGHAGEFMSDQSDNYFTIVPPQAGSPAVSILRQMQIQIGTNYEMQHSIGYQNISGYKVSLPTDAFLKAGNYLSSKFGGPNNKYTTERGYGYENWHVLCYSIGLGAGSSPSDLSYVWCADKVGTQQIDVTVRDIKSIDTVTRTFMLTLGSETMKIRMPSVVQNTQYANGTFADFVKAITSNQYQTSTFKMNGVLNGDVFEVSTIQWILG